jgi:hypothetical protein
VRTIRLDKIRGLSREEGEARRIVKSLACYAISHTVVAPSGWRRARKPSLLCLATNGDLDPSHDTSLSLRADFGQEAFTTRTPLLAPFYPVGVVDHTPDQLTGLLRWRIETAGGVPGDLDATIAVDTGLQTQCSADAAALFI